LLNDGTVLLTGGIVFSGSYYTGLSNAEIFDPAAATFTATGSMTIDRRDHSANLLNDGRVLVTGGFDQLRNAYLASAELYQ
jgi:hypothetical protein